MSTYDMRSKPPAALTSRSRRFVTAESSRVRRGNLIPSSIAKSSHASTRRGRNLPQVEGPNGNLQNPESAVRGARTSGIRAAGDNEHQGGSPRGRSARQGRDVG